MHLVTFNIAKFFLCNKKSSQDATLRYVTIFCRYYCLQIVDFVHFTGIIFSYLKIFEYFLRVLLIQFMCVLNFAFLCRSARISNISTRKKSYII